MIQIKKKKTHKATLFSYIFSLYIISDHIFSPFDAVLTGWNQLLNVDINGEKSQKISDAVKCPVHTF